MTLECSAVGGGIIKVTAPVVEATGSMAHLRMADLDSPGLLARIYNFVKSWLREIQYSLTTAVVTTLEKLRGTPVEYVVPSADGNQWKEGNRGLYAVIHGLNGRPNIWRNQLSALRKQQPDFEIRLPYVPQRGNCSLEEAVAPIEAMIRDYIEQHPGQPVCLMGVSNGGRLAMELEIRLRDTKAPIKVSSVAGALSGTKQIDLMHRFGVAKKVYSSPLVDDMLYQSETAMRILNSARQVLPAGVERAYDFYSSPNDFQIKPYTGAFPVIGQEDVSYFVVPGENHNSIVSRVSDIQIERCVGWMQEHAIQA